MDRIASHCGCINEFKRTPNTNNATGAETRGLRELCQLAKTEIRPTIDRGIAGASLALAAAHRISK